MKEKERIDDPMDELDTLLATLKKTFKGQVKTIKIRKICKDEKVWFARLRSHQQCPSDEEERNFLRTHSD
jgi:hypothetical protein